MSEETARLPPEAVAIPTGYRRQMALRAARIQSLTNLLSQILEPDLPVTLEVGCGHGHFLAAYASHHPEQFCLGFDISSKRIRKAENKRNKRGLARLHFIKAEADELLAAWPSDAPLRCVFCLFPDPWPKNRHQKNRIIQPEFLTQLARAAWPTATFHFRSDHPAGIRWATDKLNAHPDWEIDPELPWPFENPSFFQDLAPSYQSISARRAPPLEPGSSAEHRFSANFHIG